MSFVRKPSLGRSPSPRKAFPSHLHFRHFVAVIGSNSLVHVDACALHVRYVIEMADAAPAASGSSAPASGSKKRQRAAESSKSSKPGKRKREAADRDYVPSAAALAKAGGAAAAASSFDASKSRKSGRCCNVCPPIAVLSHDGSVGRCV